MNFDKVKTIVQNSHIVGADLQNLSNKQLYDIFLSGKSENMYIIKKWQDQFNIGNASIFKYVFNFNYYELINNEIKIYPWHCCTTFYLIKYYLQNGRLIIVIYVMFVNPLKIIITISFSVYIMMAFGIS